jgi:hypothetical protein
MKTLVGVNTLENVSSFVYASHCKMWVDMKKQYPDDEFIFYTPYRMSIDNMRNDCARIAMQHGCDYLMFIDDDVLVKPTTYKSLREADKDIIMALTYVRGYPFHPMFFKDFGTDVYNPVNGKTRKNLTFHDDYQDTVDEDGLVKTGAVGFSCVLIKVDVMRSMTPPYFVTGPGHTEDVYFCLKARAELEPEPEIYVDTKVSTAHLMMPDAVCDENVKKLREFYKPETDENDAIKFRMKEHIELVMQEMA